MNILNNTYLHWKFIRNREFPKVPNIEYFNGLSTQNKKAIQYYVNEGYTFIIEGYEIYNEPIKSLLSEIEQKIDGHTRINIFGSKNKATTNSYPPHLDETPLLIFQAVGKAEWNLYSNKTSNLFFRETINQNCDYSKLNQSHQFTLSPGDFLYIPQRYFHKVKDFSNEPYRLSFHVASFSSEREVNRYDKNYYQI